jgi:hypothetical protein
VRFRTGTWGSPDLTATVPDLNIGELLPTLAFPTRGLFCWNNNGCSFNKTASGLPSTKGYSRTPLHDGGTCPDAEVDPLGGPFVLLVSLRSLSTTLGRSRLAAESLSDQRCDGRSSPQEVAGWIGPTDKVPAGSPG